MTYYRVIVDEMRDATWPHPKHGHVIYNRGKGTFSTTEDLREWMAEHKILYTLVCISNIGDARIEPNSVWEVRVASAKEAALVTLKWGVR